MAFDRISSWKVTRPYSTLLKIVHSEGDHPYTEIDGDVVTPDGAVIVNSAEYHSGTRYLSLRFMWGGRCYALYTETVPTFSVLAFASRASRFARRVASSKGHP